MVRYYSDHDTFWSHPGRQWTDGDPHGFWPAYGKIQRYYPSSGAQPFHDMFSMITAITPPVEGGMPRSQPQPPSTNTSQPSSLPPHLRSLRNPRLPSPPPIDAGEAELTPEVDEEEDEYVECLKMTCADNLEGFSCRTKAFCKNRLKICPDFAKKKCPIVGFKHRVGKEEKYQYRITKTCKSITHGKPCDLWPDCPFGHDHEVIRRAVDRARRLEARYNHVRSARPLPYKGKERKSSEPPEKLPAYGFWLRRTLARKVIDNSTR